MVATRDGLLGRPMSARRREGGTQPRRRGIKLSSILQNRSTNVSADFPRFKGFVLASLQQSLGPVMPLCVMAGDTLGEH